MLVRSTTPGPLKILILDVTQNANGFEHDVSRRIKAQLVKSGIPVTVNSPAWVDDEFQFSDAFSQAGDFSVALLVAHGGKDLGGSVASPLAGPGNVDDWFSTAELTQQMQDKVLLLCVCYGYCKDAIDAFVRDSSLALSIVAPTVALEKSEAEAFFPSFLAMLQPTSVTEIDPLALRRILGQTNHLSGGKMRLFSQGLPS
jgi:hypothetical protein